MAKGVKQRQKAAERFLYEGSSKKQATRDVRKGPENKVVKHELVDVDVLWKKKNEKANTMFREVNGKKFEMEMKRYDMEYWDGDVLDCCYVKVTTDSRLKEMELSKTLALRSVLRDGERSSENVLLKDKHLVIEIDGKIECVYLKQVLSDVAKEGQMYVLEHYKRVLGE